MYEIHNKIATTDLADMFYVIISKDDLPEFYLLYVMRGWDILSTWTICYTVRNNDIFIKSLSQILETETYHIKEIRRKLEQEVAEKSPLEGVGVVR